MAKAIEDMPTIQLSMYEMMQKQMEMMEMQAEFYKIMMTRRHGQ